MVEFLSVETLEVLFLLIVLSYLFKPNNILYKIVMMIVLGRAIAYLAAEGFQNVWYANLVPLSEGDFIQIIPLIFGAMMFSGLFGYRYIARYPSVTMVASNMGATAAGAIVAQIYLQAIQPITDINVAVTIILTVLMIIYFISTVKAMETGVLRYIVKLGNIAMLFCFGWTFGGELITGASSLIERMQFVFWTWLGI